jgi:hypothetical protein
MRPAHPHSKVRGAGGTLAVYRRGSRSEKAYARLQSRLTAACDALDRDQQAAPRGPQISLTAFVRTTAVGLESVARQVSGAHRRLTQRRQCGRRRYASLRSASAMSRPRTGSQRGSDPLTSSSPSVSACNRRRHAPGEFRTRFVHSVRSWSTIVARSTSRMAMAPRAAARRSSYAARLHATEHHFLGRPPGSPIHGFPQRTHVPPTRRTSSWIDVSESTFSRARERTDERTVPRVHEVWGK